MSDEGLLDSTGFPYVRDEFTGRVQAPLIEFADLGTYTPPVDWIDLNSKHQAWMGSMPPLIHKMVREQGRKPLNIMSQMMCVKAYVRDHRTMSRAGHVLWVEFNVIDPCFVLIDDQEAYKMLSRAEYDAGILDPQS